MGLGGVGECRASALAEGGLQPQGLLERRWGAPKRIQGQNLALEAPQLPICFLAMYPPRGVWLTVWQGSAFNPWEMAEMVETWTSGGSLQGAGRAGCLQAGVSLVVPCDAEIRGTGLGPHSCSALCEGHTRLDNTGTPTTFPLKGPSILRALPARPSTLPSLTPPPHLGRKEQGRARGDSFPPRSHMSLGSSPTSCPQNRRKVVLFFTGNSNK